MLYVYENDTGECMNTNKTHALSKIPAKRFRHMLRFILFFLVWTSVWLTAFGRDLPATDKDGNGQTTGRRGLVVSVSACASDVGAKILAQGGNAVDAAVATAFALSVTYPAAGNIGGGGYLLLYPGNRAEPLAFDFRETGPAAATRDMFVKPQSRTAHRRVAVPGTVRGLALAHRKAGKLPWKTLVSPAIRLATEGFPLDAACARSLNEVLKSSSGTEYNELKRVFGKSDGAPWKAGERLVQPDLKRTLVLIAETGPDAFYTGLIANQLVEEMKRGGGLVTKEDLAGYRAAERKPIHGLYRGYDVYSVPPSSSGGITLVEALNILENFELRKHGRWSPRTLHLLAEAMKRAYRDRACYLGDPAFVKIPATLTEKPYARGLAATIYLARATPSRKLAGDIPLAEEGEHTTHISVLDKAGMAVSLTYTLESNYGSKVVVKGAGFLLNDEMNDFAWLPGVTDTTGRIGTLPNQIKPGKRMLSSMCPTIVAQNGKALLVTGSPGGRTIINTVLCVIVNVLDFEMDIQSAIDAPRMHHQWFPDRLRVEATLADEHPESLRELRRLGHKIDRSASQGDAHSIWVNPKTGEQVGAADRRISGKVSSPAEARGAPRALH
jgi:gamma-glutamyltranspeptidase/glutathione hydrolase